MSTPTTIDWQPGTPIPDGVDAVACAVPAGDDVTIVRDALEAGVPVRVGHRRHHRDPGPARARRAPRREAGVPVIVGAGLAPGLSDVLVRHAADGLDTIDDVNVARWGAAGDASASTVRVALADRGAELRDGEIVPLAKRGGEELIWFPNPVDARGCEPVSNGLELLLHAVPGLGRATIRFSRPEKPGWTLPRRADPVNEWGAIRVEVWGTRGPTHEPVVYGAIERTEIAAGTVLALTRRGAGRRAARAGGARARACTVSGGSWCPRAFLAELARRGVKVAVFEGVPVA